MTLSYTESGNNTASIAWAVSHPAAVAGDLLVFNLVGNGAPSTLTSPAGPNGEVAVAIEPKYLSVLGAVFGTVVYYIATAPWAASTVTFVSSSSQEFTATVIKVPAGEFLPTGPIGEHNKGRSSTAVTYPTLPALTAGVSDGGGLLVGCIASDIDNADGTVSGWTSRVSTDRGAVAIDIVTRDALVTANESISAVTGWTYPSPHNSVTFIYIIRPTSSGFFSMF